MLPSDHCDEDKDGPPGGKDILAAVERIAASKAFAASERLCRFLRFVTERALEGTAGDLKEGVVGNLVYGREADYDPSQDSIVRSEARRLRGKLRQYYETEGLGDAVMVELPLGGYAPVFRRRRSEGMAMKDLDGGEIRSHLYSEGAGVMLAVIPFSDLTHDASFSRCAQHVTDELVHVLMQTDGCRVAAPSSVTQALAQGLDAPTLAKKVGAQFLFEGSVRADGQSLRVMARVVNAAGFHIWSERFETEPDPNALFEVAEFMASALVSRTRPELVEIRKLKASVSDLVMANYTQLLNAEGLLDQGGRANIEVALAKFEEVAQAVPGYARPKCGITLGCCEIALGGVSDSASYVARAKVAAQQALNLDGELPSSLGGMGCVEALEMNWSAAEASFRKAIFQGSHVNTYRQLGLLYTAAGRFHEAWHHLSSAQRIDPFSFRQKLVCAKFFHVSRQPEEALRHFPGRLIYGPLPLEARLYLALLRIEEGDVDKGLSLTQAVEREAGGHPALMSSIAENKALCGRKEEAMKIIRAFDLLGAASAVSFFRRALLALAMGAPEQALEFLAESVERREAERLWWLAEPRLDPLRDEPQFAKLESRLLPR